jgi:signal peptidase I
MKKIIKEVLSLSKSILFGLILVILIHSFILQPYKVEGSSMEPTLVGTDTLHKEKVGDRLIVLKSTYLLGGEPEYNDIVIIDKRVNRERAILEHFLESPIISIISGKKEDSFWVKRVIGLPGDTLEYKDGYVYRNGNMLKEEYIKEDMNFPFKTAVVEDNHVFVMGDNRNGSRDSREIGSIPNDNIIGKVILRIFPFNKFSSVK